MARSKSRGRPASKSKSPGRAGAKSKSPGRAAAKSATPAKGRRSPGRPRKSTSGASPAPGRGRSASRTPAVQRKRSRSVSKSRATTPQRDVQQSSTSTSVVKRAYTRQTNNSNSNRSWPWYLCPLSWANCPVVKQSWNVATRPVRTIRQSVRNWRDALWTGVLALILVAVVYLALFTDLNKAGRAARSYWQQAVRLVPVKVPGVNVE